MGYVLTLSPLCSFIIFTKVIISQTPSHTKYANVIYEWPFAYVKAYVSQRIFAFVHVGWAIFVFILCVKRLQISDKSQGFGSNFTSNIHYLRVISIVRLSCHLSGRYQDSRLYLENYLSSARTCYLLLNSCN